MFGWKAFEMQAFRPGRRELLQLILLPGLISTTKAHAEFDQKFIDLIRNLSDAPTGPASADNLMTNEDSIASVADQICSEVPPDQVYLGVGPDQNFSIMALAQPSAGFIIDYRRKNQLLHLMHQFLIQLSTSRTDYFTNFWCRNANSNGISNKQPVTEDLTAGFESEKLDQARLIKLREIMQLEMKKWNILSSDDIEEMGRIQARLAGPGPDARFLALKMYPTLKQLITQKTRSGKPGHWLASEGLFGKVRKLVLSEKVFPLVGDWAREPRSQVSFFSRLGEYLSSNGQKIGCFYISDVEFFLLRQGTFSNYLANLGKLPWHPDARIIRTSTLEIEHPERIKGNSSTTICRPVQALLRNGQQGKLKRWDDLWS